MLLIIDFDPRYLYDDETRLVVFPYHESREMKTHGHYLCICKTSHRSLSQYHAVGFHKLLDYLREFLGQEYISLITVWFMSNVERSIVGHFIVFYMKGL